MSRRVLPFLAFAAFALLLLANPALAQDDGVRTTSVFKMFVYTVPDNPDFLDWVGAIQVWIILILSVVAVSLIINFALKVRTPVLVPEETRERIEQLMSEKKFKEAIAFANEDPSFLGKVVAAALNEASNGYSAMERAIDEVGDAEVTRMLRPIEMLNIIGNVAPMLGLFGTVYGMIVAFARLVQAGGRPDPAALAGGISTALVTTFWGLVVAMPAITAYAFIRNQIDAATSEGLVIAEDLIRSLKPGAKKAARGTPPANAPGSGGGRPRATPKPANA